jgi:3-oxoacyl-[acyl-carrier-protein] synthase-3
VTTAYQEREVFLSGVGVCLPAERYPVEAAVEAGVYDPERAERDGFTSVAIEHERYPVDMALDACRAAAASVRASELSSLIFTSIHRHGHKSLWPPASYLHRQLGMRPEALAYSLNHGCNSEFLAAKVAVALLQGGAESHVVVAGADCYENTLFDRWNSDLGTIYGDGASAMVLSAEPALMKILCLEVESGTTLEEMYRDPQPSPESEGSARAEYDVGSAKRMYFDRRGREEFESIFTATLGRLREKLIEGFALDESPAAYVVYPNVGAGISAAFYRNAFGDLARRDVWEFGRSIGHTGVSDQLIGLEHILESGALQRGERVLLVGAGNGLSAAVMLLEMTGTGGAPSAAGAPADPPEDARPSPSQA